MTDEAENLVLEHLRALRGKLDGMEAKQTEMLHRLNALATHTASLGKEVAAMREDIAHQWSVFDHNAERLERIERRLELNE